MKLEQVRNTYFHFLNEHRLEPDECILLAGGALVMMGLREETLDLDMEIPLSLYEYLRQAHGYEPTVYKSTEVIKHRDVFDLTPIVKGEALDINGVRCWTPQRLLHHKLTMNRMKDQTDIRLLGQHIRQHTY